MSIHLKLHICVLLLMLASAVFSQTGTPDSKQSLGQQLYFDTNLSLNRSQSCASCHDPSSAFIDTNYNASERAASLGDDGKTFGDRNAPTAAYANRTPVFHINKEGRYIGGQFWDGRAATLKDQAAGPPLAPGEMGMPDMEAVRERLLENPSYIEQFQQSYGKAVLDNAATAFDAMTDAIAAFEQSDFFSPFDSKYDRYLRGEYVLTQEEELGMTLFFSEQFTNCNQCHQLNKRPLTAMETFSDYSYHNIGVPPNTHLRELNGLKGDYVDEGLLSHPGINDAGARGKFKVPTLRNVALTGPYMHNGVFRQLRTVVAFYNKYNSKSAKRQINPETGQKWREAEISENISLTELEHGPALDDQRIDALVAFLELLTDKRFEPLLRQQ